MKNGKKIAFIILLCLSILWFIGAISWFFIYQPISEKDISQYTITINKIEPISLFRITADEYNAKFVIFSEEIVVNMDALNNLDNNQTITIGIKNSDISNLDNSNETIEIVSLKVGENNIITIESYNENNSKKQLQSSLGFCAGGVICLVISIILFLWHKGKIGKNSGSIQKN